jgi:predicted transcriptional regulator
MIKVTFRLDEETVARLRRAAARLAKPQSQVVREAIRDYEARSDKLSDEERRRLLDILDRGPPGRRSAAQVGAELREVRDARGRSGKRRAERAGE